MAKVGRPKGAKKFRSVKQLQDAIDAYFERCDNNIETIVTKEGVVVEIPKPIPYTIEGLAVALDLDRRTINNYSKDENFFPTIKKAKEKVLNKLTEMAVTGQAVPSISIFLLKNNYGYADKTEQSIEHSGEITVKASLSDFYKDADE